MDIAQGLIVEGEIWLLRGTAVLSIYPGLSEMTSVLPDDLQWCIPFGSRGWAVGQYLTGFESRITADTLDVLLKQSIVALPLHDAVLVSERRVKAAQEALEASFLAILGTKPNVRIARPEISPTEAPPAAPERSLVERIARGLAGVVYGPSVRPLVSHREGAVKLTPKSSICCSKSR